MTARRLPNAVQQLVQESFAKSKTGWWDTHPSDSERIAASTKLHTAGILLEADGSARELFRDFTATARERTRAYYQIDCGIDLDHVTLGSTEQMSIEAAAATEQEQSLHDWIGPLFTIRTASRLKLEKSAPGDGTSLGWHAQVLVTAKPHVEALLRADTEELSAFKAIALLDAGFVINAKDFGLPRATLDSAETTRKSAQNRIEAELARLDEPLRLTRQHLVAALCQASENQSLAEIDLLSDLHDRFASIGNSLVNLRNSVAALELLLINAANARNRLLWKEAAEKLCKSIENGVDVITSAFTGCEYPFVHARGVVPLPEYLVESPPADAPIDASFVRAQIVLDRASTTHYRVLAKLAVFAQQTRLAEANAVDSRTADPKTMSP